MTPTVIPFRTICNKDCIYTTCSNVCGYNEHDRHKDLFGNTVCNYTKVEGWHFGKPKGRIINEPFDCVKCSSKNDGCLGGASKGKCFYCPNNPERETD
jgi:hypothetical protein